MFSCYFTFGSDPKYPYGREDYVIVLGKDRSDCIRTYQAKYPNRTGSDCFNAADCYTEQEWAEIGAMYYEDKEPADILVSETAYGQKPEGFGSIWFAVPSENELVFIQEGTGDNLSEEDMEDGMEDYIDYTSYYLEDGEIEEQDGGELLFPYLIEDHYACLADAIPEVLGDLYEDPTKEVQILQFKG